jgi:DDE superfamily endonuclease
MSLLDHPPAQALLADAELSAEDVVGGRHRLEDFLQRYWPRFYRLEQHRLALVVLQGKLSNLQRKTAAPIAYQARRQRKPGQHFVGAGKGDDEAVRAELRQHVAQEAADPDAVLVLDGSAFAKSGADSCGVTRQWCGRLGKVENCQLGVFLNYVTAQGYAPLDRQLYLPGAWAEDPQRRQATHVPEGVTFQEAWRIGARAFGRPPHRRCRAAGLGHAVERGGGGVGAACGGGAGAPSRGGGGAWSGQRGGGVGSVRGTFVGGLAPPHDAVAWGVVVRDPGEAAAGKNAGVDGAADA